MLKIEHNSTACSTWKHMKPNGVFPFWLPRLGSGERISRSAFSVFSACKSVNNLGVLNVCLEAKNSWKRIKKWKKWKKWKKNKKSKEQGGLFAAFCTGTHQNRVLIAWASRVWATRTGGPTSECKALRKLLQPSTRTRPQPRSPETWTETGKKQQCCFSATSISMKLSLVTYDIRRKLKHLDSWTANVRHLRAGPRALHRIWPWAMDPPVVGNSCKAIRGSHVQI